MDIDPGESRTPSQLREALPQLTADADREARLVSTRRAELGKALATKGLRKLADDDPELDAQLTQVRAAIAEDERTRSAWQKDLSDASKQWEAGLVELSELPGGDDPLH